jgi:hypothetical protein
MAPNHGAPEDADPQINDLLGPVAFLRADAPVDTPMPAEVWGRLAQALENEQLTPVTELPRRRLPGKAIGGLIAASVALLIGSAVVFVDRAPAPDVVAAPTPAEIIQPARQVLASGINYTPGQMRKQLRSVLNSMGIERADQMEQMRPSPRSVDAAPDDSMATLAACIRALARSEGVQALIVDRAKYDGLDAAIIILGVNFDGEVPMMDVFVVHPNCTENSQDIIAHVMHPLD